MSRSFELLQQVDRNKGLFQTAVRLPLPPAAKPAVEDRAPEVQAPKDGITEERVVEERAKEEPVGNGPSSRVAPPRWLASLRAVSERLGIRSFAHRRNGGGQLNLRAMTLQEENKLVQRLFFSTDAGGNHVIVFSGVENGRASARVCARVAEKLAAQVQSSVCVVDANLQSPALHCHFNVRNNSGLSEALLQGGPARLYAQQLTTRNLWLIPGGLAGAKAWTLLNPDRVRIWFEELRTQFEYVLIHAPSTNESAHSILLGQSADGVIFVVEANSTRRETALHLKQRFEEANVQVLGVVLNNRTFPLPESVYRRL
jgi:Mrp family chromosome partitioning ATPase